MPLVPRAPILCKAWHYESECHELTTRNETNVTVTEWLVQNLLQLHDLLQPTTGGVSGGGRGGGGRVGGVFGGDCSVGGGPTETPK